MRRALFEDVHEDFRASFRTFLEREVLGDEGRYGQWERAGIVPREVFARAGRGGFLGMAVPERYGGAGAGDFRFNLLIGEECQRAGVASFGLGITLHNDICLPYFLSYCTGEQRERWLGGIASGELITALAMTEPGVGSDIASMSTRARREDDHYVVDGTKTFITNGINADLVIVAVKTDTSERHRGISLVVIERGMDGFERGRNLEKIGQHAQDTAELSFSEVHVPVANLLGEEGQGFLYLVSNLPQERLSIAGSAVAAAEAALGWTLDYVRERKAFDQPIGSFQNSRFTLAELQTEIAIARVFVDRCVQALNAGELTAEDAAMAKWWCTELQGRVADRCLQLHGGYGYMLEYPIARAYADARVTRIYGGANEIMKEIVGRSMGL
ncbi:MAG TPA: acyl-CoA dehydrogenase family protein [Solirubrobacteraceae bacterium]|jgi:alkylation response protein AidB-like acyl-CoA dehydrogenase|nr:acyl-CoA dehydrogenase family protein [Solirubrobacteraceae bacterium]